MGACCSNEENKSLALKKKNIKVSQKNQIIDTVDQFIPNVVINNKQKIDKVYRIAQNPLGQGAYGEVRLATHRNTNEKRAVKIIFKDDCDISEQQKIMKEVEVLTSIDHPNIVKIFEFFEDESHIYIVMEYLEGGELFNKIKQSEHFTEKRAKIIMKSIMEAINYLHKQNIVHRDLKPENILFSHDNILKIADFGTSKFFLNDKMHNRKGTPYYIAPEVLKEDYDEKCDIWSAGVILYIMLCGYPPFNGQSTDDILARVEEGNYDFNFPTFNQVSRDSKDIIKKMLTKNPSKRISAEKVLQHQWFTKQNANDDVSISKEHMENFKKFTSLNKMQQAIYFFFINQTLTSEEKKSLTQTFKSLDTNNDGILSQEELMNGLKKTKIYLSEEELKEIIAKMDQNNNNQIDYTEFIAMAINRTKIINDDRIKACFKMFDQNNDGEINIQEFKYILQGNQKVGDDVWKQMIFEVTGEQEKTNINYEEFKALLKKMINQN